MFAVVIGSETPEPVFVALLTHMPVNESIMVAVGEDGREYEVCKVFQQDLGDYDAAAFFVAPAAGSGNRAEDDCTYLLWPANGTALGLFRLNIVEGVAMGLERSENWGASWTPWAYKNDRV